MSIVYASESTNKIATYDWEFQMNKVVKNIGEGSDAFFLPKPHQDHELRFFAVSNGIIHANIYILHNKPLPKNIDLQLELINGNKRYGIELSDGRTNCFRPANEYVNSF